MKINPILILLSFVIILISCENNSEPSTQDETVQIEIEGGISIFDSLNKLIENNPTNPLLYNDRANFHLIAGEYNYALSDVSKAIQLDTLNPNIWITLADIYFAKERFVDSREVLIRALNLDPKNTSAMLKLSRLYLIYQEYETAMTYANNAIKIDPMLEDAYFIKAVTFAEKGDTSRAVLHFQKAVEVNPNFYDAWIELGNLSKAKNNTLAEQYYMNALELDTNNTHALYILAFYYQEIGKIDKSEKHYLSLLKKADNENALYNLGYINLVYLNDYPKAIVYFQKAINLNPEYHDALFNLAYALELSGDKEDAKIKYQELLKKIPDHGAAIKQLNSLYE